MFFSRLICSPFGSMSSRRQSLANLRLSSQISHDDDKEMTNPQVHVCNNAHDFSFAVHLGERRIKV